MATERDFELLDDYLANRMGTQERVAFEEQLAADPELQEALKFEQRMVEGIRDARKAELKQMLQNVQVPAPTGVSLLAKISAGTLTVALVAALVWYLKPTSSATNPGEESRTEQTEADKSAPMVQPDQPAVLNQSAPAENSEPDQETPKTKPSNKVNESTPAVASEPAPKVQPFVPEGDESNTTVDNLSENSEPSKTSTIQVTVDKENKKFNFHYSLQLDDVRLYGPFEKNLYEILEFFSGEERTVFMYYKNNYYLLEQGKTTAPLKPVWDKALIEKLNEYRKR